MVHVFAAAPALLAVGVAVVAITAAAAHNVLSSSPSSPCFGVLPSSHVGVPCVAIPSCASGAMVVVSDFKVMASGGGPATDGSKTEETHARLCHRPDAFELHWHVVDQHIVTDNCGDGHNITCSHCFDNVWQGDAAEFYLSDNLADTQQIVNEIDVSAVAGGVWAAKINNPTGYFPDSHVQISCSDITVAKGRFEAGWNASLTIPMHVVTKKQPVPKAWRINFYRMDYDMSGQAEDKHALNASAWGVTQCDGHTRCNIEHIPKYFGVAVLT